jgi:hypothetical protein
MDSASIRVLQTFKTFTTAPFQIEKCTYHFNLSGLYLHEGRNDENGRSRERPAEMDSIKFMIDSAELFA